MTPTPPHESEEVIFTAALALPAKDRSAYLDEACAGDPALRARVEELLRADESTGFMAAPATDLAATVRAAPRPEEAAGQTIGRYKLLQKIGEGGCGVVYMAEQQEPVIRRVALKVIKLGMDTKEVIARFEAERQALALMAHPNIASVLDGGATDAGRPYFVMELVRGVTITKYCDEQNLSTAARLELFTSVCHAVQHAHQKGIIHRDLKPSNILVTLHDGRPVPKVIDFGIAKATQGRLTNSTLFTAFEQFIGTPAYMSPEQAELSGLDIDTRSDIYSLGVLLYELLTGRPPFDPKTLVAAGLDEIRRIIREVDPPRPSNRLSTLTNADQSTIAKQRSTGAAHLSTLLRGDLDWIVMRCLEKDRTRRYDTPTALAADITRHLTNEPVIARPPSKGYLLQKLVARHRMAFVASGAIAAALVVGAAVATVQAVRATRAEQTAHRESATAAAVNAFLNDDLLGQASSRRQARGGFTPEPNLTLRQALDRVVPRLETRFKDQPQVEANIRQTLGGAYRQLGDYTAAAQQHTRAAALRSAALGPDHADTLSSRHDLASVYRTATRFAEARKVGRDVAERRKATLGPVHPATLETIDLLSHAYRYTGLQAEIMPLLEETLKLANTSLGPTHASTLNSMHILAQAYREAGRLSEAAALFREAQKHRTALLTSKSVDDADLSKLLGALRDTDHLETAIPLLEAVVERRKKTFGEDHPETVDAIDDLANAYRATDDGSRALPLFAEALRKRQALFGADHPDTVQSMDEVAQTHLGAGRNAAAIPLFEEVLQRRKATLGTNYGFTIVSMCNLAAAYRAAQRTDDAIPLYEEALRHFTAIYGPDHNDTISTMTYLASAYQDKGRHTDALALLEQALERRKTLLGAEHPYTLECMLELAVGFKRATQVSRGIALFEETTRLRKLKLGPDHPATLFTMKHLAETYELAKRSPEAVALHEEIVQRRQASLGTDHRDTLSSMSALAITYRAAGRKSEAIALFETVVKATRAKNQPGRPPGDTFLSSLLHLSSMYEPAQAEPLRRELLAGWLQREEPESLTVNTVRGLLARTLLDLKKSGEAETIFRECLVEREKLRPDEWMVSYYRSLLGAALLGQSKFAEAEPLLLAGYDGLKTREVELPPNHKSKPRDALERVVQLYTAWPQPEKSAEWQQKLDAFNHAETTKAAPAKQPAPAK